MRSSAEMESRVEEKVRGEEEGTESWVVLVVLMMRTVGGFKGKVCPKKVLISPSRCSGSN